MFWTWFDGAAHATLSMDEKDGQVTVVGACLREFEYPIEAPPEALPDVREVQTPQDRPYGADSCPTCHAVCKGWTVHPENIPPGLFDPPEPVRAVMSAEERRASVQGQRSHEEPVNAAKGAKTPARGGAARRGTLRAVPDDLEGGDEEVHQPGTSLDGALVVGAKGGSKKRDPEVEIDSD